MVAFEHDVLLQNCVLYLVLLYQDILSDGLDRVKLLVCLELGKEHLSEGAPSDDHQKVEIFECNSWLVIFVSYKLRVSQFVYLFLSASSLIFLDVILQVLEVVSQVIQLNQGLVHDVCI